MPDKLPLKTVVFSAQALNLQFISLTGLPMEDSTAINPAEVEEVEGVEEAEEVEEAQEAEGVAEVSLTEEVGAMAACGEEETNGKAKVQLLPNRWAWRSDGSRKNKRFLQCMFFQVVLESCRESGCFQQAMASYFLDPL